MIQLTIDQLLEKVTLADLVNTEQKSTSALNLLLEQHNIVLKTRAEATPQ
jgi:hypothetical protein